MIQGTEEQIVAARSAQSPPRRRCKQQQKHACLGEPSTFWPSSWRVMKEETGTRIGGQHHRKPPRYRPRAPSTAKMDTLAAVETKSASGRNATHLAADTTGLLVIPPPVEVVGKAQPRPFPFLPIPSWQHLHLTASTIACRGKLIALRKDTN